MNILDGGVVCWLRGRSATGDRHTMANTYRIALTIFSLVILALLIFQGFAPIVHTSTGPLALGFLELWSSAADVPGFATRQAAFLHILSTMGLGTGFIVRALVFAILAGLIVVTAWPSTTVVSGAIDWALTAKIPMRRSLVKAFTVAAVALPLMLLWKAVGYSALENRDGFEKSFGIDRPDLSERFRKLNDPTKPF
jgi:hypothetical protein